MNALLKYNADPTSEHLTAVKRVLRYLKGTSDMCLRYQQSADDELTGYSNADWAGDWDDRRSTSGNIFLLVSRAVSWLSKKQSVVALSSAEAEYISLSYAAQECVSLRQLLGDFTMIQSCPTVIHEDNQGSITIAKNPVNHSRTKHIDIKYHFIRECVKIGLIELEYCPTEEMLADVFNKPLSKQKFEVLRSKIGHCVT